MGVVVPFIVSNFTFYSFGVFWFCFYGFHCSVKKKKLL